MMAKTKKKAEEGITIDLEKAMIPGAILIAGLMISIGVFLGIRSIGDTAIGSTKGVSTTVAPTSSPISGNGTTTISNNPVYGDKTKAKIAIVEFSDYECPYCKMHYTQSYKQLIQQYVDSGKAIYVYRNYIAVTAHNPASTLEATAALCVQKLAGDAKYYDYHDYIFTNTGSNGSGINGGKDALINEAGTLGLDKNAFTSCLDDQSIAAKITSDQSDATTAGQAGTPGFIIGKLSADGTVTGYLVSGAQPLASFQSVIDQVLAQ